MKRKLGIAFAILTLISILPLLNGCEGLILFDPKGPIGGSEKIIILVSFALMLLVVVPVIIMSIWKSLGYNIIIFLIAIMSIPKEYYEAAEIDGANAWQTFYGVTLPLVMPSVFFVSLVSVISAFQTFTQIYMLTPDGGPLKSTTVIVYYLYQNAFVFFKAGYASAISFIIFAVIFTLTLLQNRYWGERIHYEN